MAVANGALAVGKIATWPGTVRAAASERGLREVWLPRWEQFAVQANNRAELPTVHIETAPSSTAEALLHAALGELAEYFAGKRRVFTIALDLQGTTSFNPAWPKLAQSPWVS